MAQEVTTGIPPEFYYHFYFRFLPNEEEGHNEKKLRKKESALNLRQNKDNLTEYHPSDEQGTTTASPHLNSENNSDPRNKRNNLIKNEEKLNRETENSENKINYDRYEGDSVTNDQ